MSMESERLPILSLDFDGTIHSYVSGWKGARNIPDPPVDGAINFIIKAVDVFDVQIFSSRSHQFWGRRAMRRWLVAEIEKHLQRSDSWMTVPAMTWMDACDLAHAEAVRIVSSIGFPKHKPAAFLSLDDRAVRFTGIFMDPEYYLRFKTWQGK